MWLAILIIAPVAIVLLGRYHSRVLVRSVAGLFPRREQLAGRVRQGYLLFIYSVPALLLLWVAYILIARPEHVSSPSHWLLDYGVVLPFWFLVIWSVQSALLMAPVRLIAWGIERTRGPLAPAWQRRHHAAVLVIAAACLVYMPIRIALDQRRLDVRHFEVASPEVPAELDGLRIALLADPQADEVTTEARIAQMVDAANAERPDLALIAGDIITRETSYVEPAARALARLNAPMGIVSCIGDHENFAYRDRERSVREVRQGLAKHGIAMLDDEVRWYEVGGKRLAVVVATDNYVTPLDAAGARALMQRAATADYTIVLAHQARPPLIAAAREAGARLMLAGHTHGGQVRLWFGVDLVAARIESPYITGRYRGGPLGPVELIVSSGLGTSILPFRYRAPATVEIITLRRAGS